MLLEIRYFTMKSLIFADFPLQYATLDAVKAAETLFLVKLLELLELNIFRTKYSC